MHDDLGRIDSAGCGSVWAQTFSYDAFGNVTKSGSVAWQPGYSQTTNRYQNGSTHDADGNLLNDTFHAYTWDVYGKMTAVDSTTLTYDAFGRMVEQNKSGTYYQIVYTPMGSKFGVFKGSTIQHLKVPLPGGVEAEYSSTGLTGYRHKDWLGSNRLETGPSHAIIGDNAYGPYGEVYARTGNAEISFTGQDSDTVWPQYDFQARQYTPNQGRWISPDTAGLAAVDPTNPQNWNRYAYVMNNPLSIVDPFGSVCVWDDGIYDSWDDPVTGSPSGCAGAGGTWFANINGNTTPDYNPNGNAFLAWEAGATGGFPFYANGTGYENSEIYIAIPSFNPLAPSGNIPGGSGGGGGMATIGPAPPQLGPCKPGGRCSDAYIRCINGLLLRATGAGAVNAVGGASEEVKGVVEYASSHRDVIGGIGGTSVASYYGLSDAAAATLGWVASEILIPAAAVTYGGYRLYKGTQAAEQYMNDNDSKCSEY